MPTDNATDTDTDRGALPPDESPAPAPEESGGAAESYEPTRAVNVQVSLDELLDEYIRNEVRTGPLDADENLQTMSVVLAHESSEHRFSTEYSGVELRAVVEVRRAGE